MLRRAQQRQRSEGNGGEDQQGNLYYTNFDGEVVQITDGDFPAFVTIFTDGFEG